MSRTIFKLSSPTFQWRIRIKGRVTDEEMREEKTAEREMETEGKVGEKVRAEPSTMIDEWPRKKKAEARRKIEKNEQKHSVKR